MSSKHKKGVWKTKVLARLALTIAPLPKNTFCSIDVTNKCNLRCKHCYFYSYKQNETPELSADEWLGRIESMQTGKHPFYSCTWVGGEPLLRKEVIDRGKKFFASNRVVTNGSISLPEWQNVDFHISVDGTEEIHDSIRGTGSYQKIRKTISESTGKGLKIVLACCINKTNEHSIETLAREWSKVKEVDHMLFDFFTPIRGKNENMWLDFDEREKVLDRLENLRIELGSFIGAPPKTFWLMRRSNYRKAVGKNCVCVKNGIALDAWGNVKKPCVMGNLADCERCGCIVPFSLRAWKMPSNLIREAFYEIVS